MSTHFCRVGRKITNSSKNLYLKSSKKSKEIGSPKNAIKKLNVAS